MAKITKILHNGLYILPETVTDAVLDNNMKRTLTEMLDDKLSSAEDDTAHGKITLAGGAVADYLSSTTYTSGFGGKGYEIKVENGMSYLIVDNAYIRNKATFLELEIREVTHTGGVEIKSPASCTIADVELFNPHVAYVDADGNEVYASDGQFMVKSSTTSGYKCYFKASDGEKTIYNDWRVGDLALCHSFNLASGSRYYHRRVLAVSAEPENGYHWVTLSETDAQGTDTPIKGDKIVCFGSKIKDRQNAIVLASNGDNAPYFAQLKGLNSFAISEDNYITLLSPTKNIIKGHEIILLSESGDKNVGEEIKSTKAALSVQSDRISSVVSKQSAMVVDYTFADFVVGEMTWVETSEGIVLGYNNDNTSYHWLRIQNVKKGDVIRFETSGYTGALVYSIMGCDGDADGAEVALIRDQNPIVDQYTWLGKQLFEVGHDNEDISETIIPMDCAEVYVYTSDDWHNKGKTKVSHIKAKMTAQSRIDQSADNIRLQVGQAGINLDTKVITLDASKTIVTGDLAVRTVKCYYDAAQTQIKSAYNGNGDGTIVYYYPNGMVMRQDSFVTDSSGNAIGMRTTYYNADGSVSWVLDNSGLKTTLSDYWEALNGAQPMAYTTDYNTMMNTCKQWLDQAMQYFDESTFSRFVSQSGNYKNYNGKVAKGLKSSEAPTAVTLFAGVLVYSVELYKDGLLPTYIVTYELVTTAQNQVGAIMTQKFNVSGEVN